MARHYDLVIAQSGRGACQFDASAVSKTVVGVQGFWRFASAIRWHWTRAAHDIGENSCMLNWIDGDNNV
jgi:hypothetical protein